MFINVDVSYQDDLATQIPIYEAMHKIKVQYLCNYCTACWGDSIIFDAKFIHEMSAILLPAYKHSASLLSKLYGWMLSNQTCPYSPTHP